MSTEIVLLLGIYAFILLGVFLGPVGPVATFRESTPRLAAMVERNVSIGFQHRRADRQGRGAIEWQDPE